MYKNRPDSLINQRLPGLNGTKIGIYLYVIPLGFKN